MHGRCLRRCTMFLRRLKLKHFFIATGVFSVIFILLQIRSVPDPHTAPSFLSRFPLRGVHLAHSRFYYPNADGFFVCLKSGEALTYDKVNDDYCDCADDSDEPGTSACPNGKFYCQMDVQKKHVLPLPSGMVNDGICDCCDGSDEWMHNEVPLMVSGNLIKDSQSFGSHCENTC